MLPIQNTSWPLDLGPRWSTALFIVVLASLGLLFMAVWTQPLMADDWYLTWYLADYGSIPNFVSEMYLRWGGRVLPFALAGLALSSEAASQVFKLLTVPCFLLLSGSICYLANGIVPGRGMSRSDLNRLLLVTALLWLGLPVPGETMIQVTGAAAYLWPATAGLFMLCLLRRARDLAYAEILPDVSLIARVSWLVMGIVIGTGNEQLVAAMTIVVTGWGWILWRDGRLRHLPPQAWWGVAGLLIGTAILVVAPGNYVRLGVQVGSSGLLSTIFRFVLYLGGAYFGLGTGDLGRALWLGICLIVLTGAIAPFGRRRTEAGIWLVASLGTLGAMLPLVNYASPRTTFLAVSCLVVASMTLWPQRADAQASQSNASALLVLAVWMLVFMDGFAGWTANRSLALEMSSRLAIIRAAAACGQESVDVPYLATSPSRLTFLLTPEHDSAFVTSMAVRMGVPRGRHDTSESAPKPLSLNPLKALKNSF